MLREMEVFHGTNLAGAKSILRDGIILTKGVQQADNGQGFYTTPDIAFARERARQIAEKSQFYDYELYIETPTSDLYIPAVVGLKIAFDDMDPTVRMFDGCSDEWKRFVFFNRLKEKFFQQWGHEDDWHNRDGKYGVVIDETADTKPMHYVKKAMYESDGKDLQKYWSQIAVSSNPQWGSQISFHTNGAIKTFIQDIFLVEP